jgi:hypothetical protein
MENHRKYYLDVPYSERQEAKRLGAWWDPRVRKWYARFGERVLTERWGARINIRPPTSSAKAALCLLVYGRRYYFQKTPTAKCKPIGSPLIYTNALGTLYRALEEEANFKKTDVIINSKSHVIHGAVYYLVTSSREPMGRKLASFDRNEISAGQEFTWTANTAINEFLLLSNLFSSLT